MIRQRSGLVGSLLLAGPGVMLLFAPLWLTGGVDTGAVGFALVVAAAWSGLAAIAKSPPTPLEGAMTPAEMEAWVALGFITLMTVWSIVAWRTFQGPALPENLAATRFGGRFAMMVIAWLLVSWLLRRRWEGRVQRDERDREIEARAGEWARVALTVCVFALSALLAYAPAERLAGATPLLIAHLLIVAWLLSCVVERAATVAAYWRDRH